MYADQSGEFVCGYRKLEELRSEESEFCLWFKKNKHSFSFIEQFEFSRHYCHFFHQPHSCCSSLTAKAHNKSLYK